LTPGIPPADLGIGGGTIVLPDSVLYIGDMSFGDESSFLVYVPNERVRDLVINSGFNGTVVIK
jgi:hypothetical protein